jgi:hypothetical protein
MFMTNKFFMKTGVIIFLTWLALAVHAQTNDLHFEVLHTAVGDFTNADLNHITAATVHVSTDNGGKTIAITNLEPALQLRLGYSPERAAAEEKAAAAQKEIFRQQEIARQKLIASLRGPVQSVRLLDILDGFGQCRIQTTNGSLTVYMMDLPASAKIFLTKYWQQKNYIDGETDRVKNLARAADRADANAPVGASGPADYVNAVMAQRTVANNMIENANNAAQDLSETKEKFEAMSLQLEQQTTFNAYFTGLLDNGIQRWQAVQ